MLYVWQLYSEPSASVGLLCLPSTSQCHVARSTSHRSTRCRTGLCRVWSTTTGWSDVVSYASDSIHATHARTTSVACSRRQPRRLSRSVCVVAYPSCRSTGSTSTRSAQESLPATRSRRSRRCSSSTGRRSLTRTPTSATARLASASNTRGGHCLVKLSSNNVNLVVSTAVQ